MIKLYLQRLSLFVMLAMASAQYEQIWAQCPGADRCVDATVFCSLGELNGFACHATNTAHYPCEAGCWKGGPTGFTNWWGFSCSGGVATISMNNACGVNDGFRWGINEGDCCGTYLYCTTGCDWSGQKSQFTYNFKPCKTYYLWVLDCGSVTCDFTVSAVPALGPASLSPLGFINNEPSGMIGPLCEGGHTQLLVNPQPGACDPYYVWTINGKEIGQPGSNHNNFLNITFSQAGDFILCVTAIIGNHWSGSICDQQGPVCTTVKVRHTAENEDKLGPPRTLCNEVTMWHGQFISSSGTYRTHLKDPNFGCTFDSVIEFILKPVPDPGNVYYITCDNKPFIDLKGRSYLPCISNLKINLPKSTDPDGCDSSIILTAINVDYAPKWKIRCFGGLVEISLNVSIVKPCNAGESYQFSYKWYAKNDPAKKSISTDENLLVSAEDEEYCVDVIVGVNLGTSNSTCVKSFCESFKESDYNLKCFNLIGDTLICRNQNGVYRIDSLFKQKVNYYTWKTTGGTVVSKVDSAAVEVRWDLKSGDTGIICASYFTDCGTSCERCLKILIGSSSYPYAGPNDSICDLKYTFKGKKDYGGNWKQISGPGQSMISDTTDPESNVIVDHYGKYQFIYIESIGACNNTDTVDLYFNQKTDSSGLNVSLHYCDSAFISGNSYYQSENFTQYLKSLFGCDSTVNTSLVISKSSTTDIVQTVCDSVIINNQVYYQSGIYTQSLVSTENCDSLLYLNLTIGKTKTVDLKVSGCDSLVIGGKAYYQTGIYPEVYQGVTNCDSLVNLDLTIYQTQRDSLSFSDCDKVVYKGKIYTQTGDYPEFYKSVNGCDSIVNVHINITSSNKAQLNETKCDSVTINGVYYDQSGNYTQKLTSANGCDSILNIALIIGSRSSFNYKLTSCDSAFIVDQWYYQTGNYTRTLLNTYQCDSTLNVALTINKSTSGDTIFRSCDSVTINGITYRQTGIYQQTLSNATLCDSVLIIDFTRLSKSSTNLKYKSCDSIELNNIVYRQTGIYSQKLSNVNQCDSLLSLDITIHKGTTKDSTAHGCDSLIFNGQTYNQSGNYNQKLSNADLCDSSLNLSLTIYKSSTTDNVLRACDSVFKFGKWFYQSGNYPQYLKDVHQCDSTVNFHLTINNGGQQTIYKTACDSLEFSGIWFTKSGQYYFYLLNTNGCDSTITLDLTIKPGNPSTLDAGPDTTICDGEVIKLNGNFSGFANFIWYSKNGILDNPNNLSTNFYSKVIGDERIYLLATDDCKQWLDSLNVHIFPRRVVQVTGDTLVNPCKEIRFTASGGTNYIWTPSSFIECLDPPCSRVLLKSSAITQFTITTDGPCAEPATLNLSLAQVQTDVYLPNAFSPNGDNINDIFLPVFNCEQVDYFSLQIFDRWGNLLFESQSKDKGWNGKLKDQLMNPGVYPFVLQYQVHGSERRVKAGDVTLVR